MRLNTCICFLIGHYIWWLVCSCSAHQSFSHLICTQAQSAEELTEMQILMQQIWGGGAWMTPFLTSSQVMPVRLVCGPHFEYPYSFFLLIYKSSLCIKNITLALPGGSVVKCSGTSRSKAKVRSGARRSSALWCAFSTAGNRCPLWGVCGKQAPSSYVPTLSSASHDAAHPDTPQRRSHHVWCRHPKWPLRRTGNVFRGHPFMVLSVVISVTLTTTKL